MREGRVLSGRFSLRRLFVYVTAICLVSGVFVQHPDLAVAVLQMAAKVVIAAVLLVPTLLACRFYAYSSHRPRLSIFVAVIGACIGAFLSPGWSANAEQIVRWFYGFGWNVGLQHFGTIDAFIPPLAAILFGSIGRRCMQAAKLSSPD